MSGLGVRHAVGNFLSQRRARQVAPLAPPGPFAEQPFVEQLQRGHRALLFEPALEHEFRDHYRRATRWHARLAFIAGIIACLATLPLEVAVFRTPATALEGYQALIFGVLVPVLLASLLISLRDASGRATRVIMALDLLIAALVVSALRATYAHAGVEFPYDAGSFIGVIVFLLSGHRFRPALAIATAVLAVMALADAAAGASGAAIARTAFNYVTTGALAGAGGYLAEYVARSEFLHRNINDYRASTDPLTGLLNRRGFDRTLARIWRQAHREHRPVAVMIANLDGFRPYNDAYGHAQGDEALRTIARLVRQQARRPLDFGARVSADEFMVFWYDVSPQRARAFAEELRAAVEQRALEHRDAPSGRLTVSCGCALSTPEDPAVSDELLASANAALCESKNAGRNRVVVALPLETA